jgi:hypothetical protein
VVVLNLSGTPEIVTPQKNLDGLTVLSANPEKYYIQNVKKLYVDNETILF